MKRVFVSGIDIDGVPTWDTVKANNTIDAIRIAEEEMNLDCVQTHNSSFAANTRCEKLEKALFGETRKRYQSPKNAQKGKEIA